LPILQTPQDVEVALVFLFTVNVGAENAYFYDFIFLPQFLFMLSQSAFYLLESFHVAHFLIYS